MFSSTFNHKSFKPLKLSEKIYVKQVKTVKISDSSECSDSEYQLSCCADCNINYDLELLHIKFMSNKFEWILKKISIYYNGKITKEHSFPDGVASSGLFETIDFELSIAEMKILFYNRAEKAFTFELVYLNCLDDEDYMASYAMELPKFNGQHHDLEFKNFINFYHPNKDITSFFQNDFEAIETSSDAVKAISLEFAGFRRMKALLNRYESFGYSSMFQRMLSIEDLTVQKALDELTVRNKLVRPTSIRYHFEVNFDGKMLSEKLGFNHLVLTPMTAIEAYAENRETAALASARIFNKIIKIDGSRVVFEKPRREFITLTTKYQVELVENRMQVRLACKVLERIVDLKLEPFFTTFDASTLSNQPETNFGDPIKSFQCCNPAIGTNQSQMEAVKNIVNRTSFPSPYIVFGPPGTGKTSTLVEAIAQIVKLQPLAKILVTANSNAACDEIGERLLKFVSRYKMYRLYSPSFDISFPDRHMRLNPLMKPISNMKHELNNYPSYEEFYSYNIIISTLVNCGRMITANIVTTHFDYIFIDECASTIEPLAIIPIGGLGVSLGCVNAQVILAGDHMQLQGMVHAYFNEKTGFGISLMERVMMLEKYQYPYDSRYVTQLTDNFRSHWAILRFSNYRFYHSVLRAKQTREIADFAIGWDLLPNKCFPLIFHSILAPSEMDGTSLYNDEEIHVVASYIKVLLKDGIEEKKVEPSDIGIICPYGAQRKRLQEKFKNIAGLEIGTVDAFQGREKLIIIMSTVRSQTPTVGFLKNEKRLNVALTRAKALLIVIGNGETLQKNKLWYKFLNYCYQHGALIGEKFMLRYRKSIADKKVQKPHPMFRMPKVEIIVQSPEVIEDEESSEYETDDESDWVSDSNDGSESDVSWTHEDYRMKARTSKVKKWKKLATLLPRVTINVRQQIRSKERTSIDDDLVNRFKQLRVSSGLLQDQNNNVEEITATWSCISEKIKSVQSIFKSLVGGMNY